MRDEELTLERFEELLDTHGAQLSRWPSGPAAAAERLIERGGAAAELHAQALQLSAVLDAHEAQEPSAELRRRVAEIPLRHPRAAAGLQLPWLLRAFWRTALAGALVSGLGFAAGAAFDGTTQPQTGQQVSVASQQAAQGADEPDGLGAVGEEDELEALMALAFVQADAADAEDWP